MLTIGKPLRRIALILTTVLALLGMGSCGTTHAHFGIDHDIAYDWGSGYYYGDGGHYHHKPPKHKNHGKKYRKYGKKYEKHARKYAKKHHHHHDD